ncbi:enoyl-CoA hydratase/isomerase family protein [Pseudahrensia aquimaris]|uniref:Enoyl-CoA hydratase/isomerase family protein n=1 Tax=Pseudahrensia aquimaris TaxID=744461 RepID=A0ABW3FH69_9HYPH
MSYETIKFEINDGVAIITLNRPEDANALTQKLAEELFDASVICQTDDAIRAVVITGAGKLFCGGGDLKEFDQNMHRGEAHLIHVATILHAALIRFAKMDAPVIMAVNGTAGGGGFSVALAGDFVIAADHAKFVSAYTASSLTPDGSSTYFLAKHVGLLRAKELMLTNRVLTAHEAQEWGIVNRVVDASELMDEAIKLAQQFANGPTKAYGGTKRLLLTAYSDTMETQLDKEAQSIGSMMNTVDGPHGVSSFLNKQKPKFTGK